MRARFLLLLTVLVAVLNSLAKAEGASKRDIDNVSLSVRASSGQGNLALNRPTEQSGTSWGGDSSRAVDGNANTHWGGASCTHTTDPANGDRSWWQVDLGQDYDVSSITITNRGDCCGSRLGGLDVTVSKTSGTAGTLCVHHAGTVAGGATIALNCDSAITGRYVRITNKADNPLTLCEVQVREGLGNLALNQPTEQSGTAWGGESSRAVDGNANTHYGNGGSCTHTAKPDKVYVPGRGYQHVSLRHWWQVDLGDFYDVTSVTITNRGDCCGSRLKDFDVHVITWKNTPGTLCYHHDGPVADGATVTLECNSPIRGHYVRITNIFNSELTLCEVEVKGSRPSVGSGSVLGNEDVEVYLGNNGIQDKQQGTVNINLGGVWGTICSDGWSKEDAIVLCGMLGHRNPYGIKTHVNAEHGQGLGNVHLTKVSCNGDEKSIVDCKFSMDTGTCTHQQDAGVTCWY